MKEHSKDVTSNNNLNIFFCHAFLSKETWLSTTSQESSSLPTSHFQAAFCGEDGSSKSAVLAILSAIYNLATSSQSGSRGFSVGEFVGAGVSGAGVPPPPSPPDRAIPAPAPQALEQGAREQ
jgi:hypothetical protein